MNRVQLLTEAGPGVERVALDDSMRRSLSLWAVLSMGLFEGILLSDAWGNWETVAALCALSILRSGVIMLGASWLKRPELRVLGTWLLLVGNLLISTAVSELLQWNLLAWLNVLFQVLFLNGLAESVGRSSMQRFGLGAYLTVSAVLALREGSELSTIGLFCLMSCVLYIAVEVRCRMLVSALEASRESHRQLQRMQAQLVAQEKLSSLGVLAAGVAHEINNPMAFVTSNVRLLAKDLEAQPHLPEVLREYVDDVLPATLEGIRRVNSIVADLRRFAHEDPGAPTPFDLNNELTLALRLAQSALQGRGELRVNLGELPIVVGQARQIGQVLVNLLVNAAQALPARDGVVEVSTHARPGEVLVRVRDNGVGMSAEVRDKLFQPFFTTKPVGEGTGLGLAVAYGIITGHGGRIEVESEPGRGSCFTVRLPVAAAEVQVVPASASSHALDVYGTAAAQ
ncbi:histidine kinase [Archangium violaceum]|uniref:sensor histidine kinase n=1 Tax=Archangium violaceum TaxID=83451 RepID=UPI002B288939|nr:histidine kinase [Archangium violaceum]